MTTLANAPAYTLPGVPVVQPPHLETGDASLATEVLPGPPPLLSVQQSAAKRDPKKPVLLFSYLPATDPGSTYSGNMAGTSTLGVTDVDGPRRKRARVDKGGSAIGRAQRASARNLNAISSPYDTSVADTALPELTANTIPDSDPLAMPVDSDTPSISRSNSSNNVPESSSSVIPAKRGPGRPKGKGKQVEKAVVRVKEEEMAPPSLSPDPVATAAQLNEDHCSACLYTGALVYCDGCPRAYHLWCLDPPIQASDIPEGDKWFCGACSLRKNPPSKPPPSLMSPLILQAQTSASTPREYQVPDDIRNFFKDVGAGPRGAYLDLSEAKKPRLNHYGQVEERDPYRLKDRNNAPVLCFRCGTSALAESASAPPTTKRPRRSTSKVTNYYDTGKPVISCDYCSLHWHLDCLDPPLATIPSYAKKWMCPNHADHTLMPKRRIPKQNAPPIEITKTKQFNNGNIEVIQPQTSSGAQSKVAVDEVLINGRRYRVPERVIKLDFWSKISSGRHASQDELASVTSSPLTSLSSFEDLEDDIPYVSLESSSLSPQAVPDTDVLAVAQLLCSLRTQGESQPIFPNGIAPVKSVETTPPDSAPTQPTISERPKRALPAKRAASQITHHGRQSGTAKLPLAGPLPTSTLALTKRSSRIRIKAEPEEITEVPLSQQKEPANGKTIEQKIGVKRGRKPKMKKDVTQAKSDVPFTTMPAPILPTASAPDNSLDSAPPSLPTSTPSPARAPASTTSPSRISASTTAPTTPSLKIRLPRLSGFNLNLHTPTRSPSSSSLPNSNDSRLRRSSRQRLPTSNSQPLSIDFSPSLPLESPTSVAAKANGTNTSTTPPS